MVALDVKRGLVTSEGWQKVLNEKAVELGQLFERKGAGSILFTNIDVEGQQRGIDISPTKQLIEALRIPVIAAGGVTTIERHLVVERSRLWRSGGWHCHLHRKAELPCSPQGIKG